VLAVGAATANDMIYQQQTTNVRLIRESMFGQAIALTHVLHGQENLRNVQILILIVSTCPLMDFYTRALTWNVVVLLICYQ
jgi:hypothetical protein